MISTRSPVASVAARPVPAVYTGLVVVADAVRPAAQLSVGTRSVVPATATPVRVASAAFRKRFQEGDIYWHLSPSASLLNVVERRRSLIAHTITVIPDIYGLRC